MQAASVFGPGLAAVFAMDAVTVSWAPADGGGAITIPVQLERGGLMEQDFIATRRAALAFQRSDVAALLPRAPQHGDRLTFPAGSVFSGVWVIDGPARQWTESDPHGLMIRLEAVPL